jgi:hypothetical protein
MDQMPLPSADVPRLDPARKAAMRELVEYAVANEKAPYPRLRMPVAVGLGAAVALAGGTAAAYVLTQRPVTETSLVHCFSRAELSAAGEFPGTSVAVTVPSRHADGPAPIEDALAACAQAWQDGLLDPSAPIGAPLPDPDPRRNAAVPDQLAVCVTPDGAAAVVPGGPAACATLELPLREQ